MSVRAVSVRRWTAGAVLGRAAVVAVVLVLLLAAGFLSTREPVAAMALGIAVAAVGVTAVQPGLLPLLVLPTLLIILRVGGGIDVAVADVMLALAALPAVILAPRPFSPHLRSVLWAAVAYQFATLLAVVANPYSANVVEWLHAGVLVIGGLFVGWAVGAHGLGRAGIRILLAAMCGLALIAIVQGLLQWARGDFSPLYVTWPYAMHKNFVGTMCALGACMAYARPAWVGLSSKAALLVGTITVGGVVFTQSRQAVIGLVAAIFVLVFRSRSDRRRTKLIVLLAVPVVALVLTVVQDQVKSGNQFNSFFQRVSWFQDSMTVWATDPVFGVGLRWWYTDRFPFQFQPPNAEIEVLTSAGVVGLLAFLALAFVCLRVAWRLPVAYGSLALAVLVNRFTQAQLDLFWAASQASLPFVVLGLCIGGEWFDRGRGVDVAKEWSPADVQALSRRRVHAADPESDREAAASEPTTVS